MNAIAIVIGYLVLTLIGLIMLPCVLAWIYVALENFQELRSRKRVIRLLKRIDEHSAKTLGSVSLEALKSIGVPMSFTLEQTKEYVERIK